MTIDTGEQHVPNHDKTLPAPVVPKREPIRTKEDLIANAASTLAAEGASANQQLKLLAEHNKKPGVYVPLDELGFEKDSLLKAANALASQDAAKARPHLKNLAALALMKQQEADSAQLVSTRSMLTSINTLQSIMSPHEASLNPVTRQELGQESRLGPQFDQYFIEAVARHIMQTKPKWFTGDMLDQRYQSNYQAEVVRVSALLSNQRPEDLAVTLIKAQVAKSGKAYPGVVFVCTEYLQQITQLRNTQEQSRLQSISTQCRLNKDKYEAMIAVSGGTPLSEIDLQTSAQALQNQFEVRGDQYYNKLLKSKQAASLGVTGINIVARETMTDLTASTATLLQNFNRLQELKSNEKDSDKIQSYNRELITTSAKLDRLFMYKMRLRQAMDWAKSDVLRRPVEIPKSQTAIQQESSMVVAAPVAAEAVKMQDVKIVLKPGDVFRTFEANRPRARANGKILMDAVLSTLKNNSVNTPFEAGWARDKTDNRLAGSKPQNLLGDPLIWISYPTLVRENGMFRQKEVGIYDYTELITACDDLARQFPNQPLPLSIGIHEQLMNMFFESNMKNDPSILEKFKKEIGRYFAPEEAKKLSGMRLTL